MVLTGEKNGLLKKLLGPFLGVDADVEYILEQLTKRKISVKKAGDNLYEIYYNGKLITVTDASETGAFLKNNFWKTERQLEGKTLNEARRSKKNKKDFESILKGREEKIQKYEKIISRWAFADSIRGISKLEIIEYIYGFTKHLDTLSELIRDNKIVVSIQSDSDFLEIFDLFADNSQKARGTKNLSAFAYGDIIYVKETDFIGDFLDNICHEGSHCIDYLDELNKKEIGTIRDQESRAFGHEMDFQKATGRKPIFDSEKEKLDHIDENYDN